MSYQPLNAALVKTALGGKQRASQDERSGTGRRTEEEAREEARANYAINVLEFHKREYAGDNAHLTRKQ